MCMYNFWLNEHLAHFANFGSLIQKTVCHLFVAASKSNLVTYKASLYTELGAQKPPTWKSNPKVNCAFSTHKKLNHPSVRDFLVSSLRSTPKPGEGKLWFLSPSAYCRALSCKFNDGVEFTLTYVYSSTLNQKNQEWQTFTN